MLLVDSARRTEINSAEKFADNHQIHTADGIAPERRAVDESFENGYRPQVGIIAEQLPKIEQPVLAFFSSRQVIVFRIANGAEENGIRFQANVSSRLRQRLTGALDSDRANVGFDEFEFVIVLPGNDFQNPVSFSQHFRADAITGQPRYARFHGLKLNPDRRLSSSDQ